MNQIKQGYKQTKVGIIPEDWEITPVGDLFTFKNGLNKEKEFFGTGTPIVNYVDVYKQPYLTKQNIQGLVTVSEKELNNYDVKKGDVFFTRTSETINEIGLTTVILEDLKDTVFSGFVLRGRPKNKKLNDNFKKYCFSTFKARKEIIRKSSMTTRALTNGTLLSEVLIITPPIKEQEKIAEILTTCDETINKQEELIEAKIKQKKALSQKLLSGKVRFRGFTDEWKDIKLGEIIKEINFKTTISNQYEVLSVTKNGIYSQQEHFNKQIASEDNTGYKIVKYGNLVFSSMNLWMGSLDILRNYDIGIVSPAYKVFEIDYTKFDIDFIQHYLKSHYMIWLYNMNSEQGASIVRRNLDLNSLLTTKVKIPSFDEQSKIGEVLSISDKELDLLKKELEEVKEQKKALMQKLLTGEVRVRI